MPAHTHRHSLVFIHMSIEPATSIHLAPLHRYKGAQPTHDTDTHTHVPTPRRNEHICLGIKEEQGACLAWSLVRVVWQQRSS